MVHFWLLVDGQRTGGGASNPDTHIHTHTHTHTHTYTHTHTHTLTHTYTHTNTHTHTHSGLVGCTGGVRREQRMLREHLPRVMHHQVYK